MINNRRVYESNATIKSLARQTLSGRWAEALLVVFVYFLIINVPPIVLANIPSFKLGNWLMPLYNLIIGAPLSLGISAYFLKVFRRLPGGLPDLRTSFNYFGNAVSLYVMIYFYIMLWSMLFIIPGIIAAIRYSQAWYIMADDPGKPAAQCIFESKLMMFGNKDKYFRLLLSFLGWIVLAKIPPSLVELFLHPELMHRAWTLKGILDFGLTRFFFTNADILVNIASLGMLLVNIYMSTSQACFYDLLNGNLIVAAEEAAVEPDGEDIDAL